MRNAALVTSLGRALPKRIELVLLTNDRDAFTLRDAGDRVRFGGAWDTIDLELESNHCANDCIEVDLGQLSQ